jgi:hypothetical protein
MVISEKRLFISDEVFHCERDFLKMTLEHCQSKKHKDAITLVIMITIASNAGLWVKILKIEKLNIWGLRSWDY